MKSAQHQRAAVYKVDIIPHRNPGVVVKHRPNLLGQSIGRGGNERKNGMHWLPRLVQLR